MILLNSVHVDWLNAVARLSFIKKSIESTVNWLIHHTQKERNNFGRILFESIVKNLNLC